MKLPLGTFDNCCVGVDVGEVVGGGLNLKRLGCSDGMEVTGSEVGVEVEILTCSVGDSGTEVRMFVGCSVANPAVATSGIIVGGNLNPTSLGRGTTIGTSVGRTRVGKVPIGGMFDAIGSNGPEVG